MQGEVRTGLPFFDLMLAFQDAMVRPFATAASGTRSTALVLHRGAARQEHVIPLAEETLNVEARKVSGRTTRVRRYVVESPVERRVALRDERVVVERRRPVAVNGAGDTLVEKTVEATETHEVPVVWKGVRVREEVVLRLESTERTETVRETIRRDEVDIEQPSRVTAMAQREHVGNPAQVSGEAKAVIHHEAVHREQAGSPVQVGAEAKTPGHRENGGGPAQSEAEQKPRGSR